MGTVNVLTAEKTLQLLNDTIVSGLINEDGELIFTKQDGTTINAGEVGTDVDTSGLRPLSNAEIDFVAGDAEATVETTTINDDGTDTADWPNRWIFKFVPAGGTARKTTYLNEYGEFRCAPAKETTTAARFFVKDDPTNPSAARDADTPVVELMDDPVNRNNLWGLLGDGTEIVKGIPVSRMLVLATGATIPAGTPAGTVILRT